MSAFICSDSHIITLIHHWNESLYSKKTESELTIICNTLKRQNYKSFNYRYNDKGGFSKLIYSNDSNLINRSVNLFDCIKLAKCLDYQSCETESYYRSKSFIILQGIIADLYDSAFRNELNNKSNVWCI